MSRSATTPAPAVPTPPAVHPRSTGRPVLFRLTEPATPGPTAARVALYTGAILALLAVMPAVVGQAGARVFTDGGPVEITQVILLGLITAAHAAAAWKAPAFRAVFTINAGLTAFAVVRELDHALDPIVPVLGWKIGYVVLMIAAFLVLRHPEVAVRQLAAFGRTRAVVMYWAGLLIAIPIGQLVGHGDLLKPLAGDAYDHHAKHAIEEILECVGYLVLGFAATEAVIERPRPDTVI